MVLVVEAISNVIINLVFQRVTVLARLKTFIKGIDCLNAHIHRDGFSYIITSEFRLTDSKVY